MCTIKPLNHCMIIIVSIEISLNKFTSANWSLCQCSWVQLLWTLWTALLRCDWPWLAFFFYLCWLSFYLRYAEDMLSPRTRADTHDIAHSEQILSVVSIHHNNALNVALVCAHRSISYLCKWLPLSIFCYADSSMSMASTRCAEFLNQFLPSI